VSRHIRGRGVPEHRWRRWALRTPIPRLRLPPVDRVLVVAPHPDDEVLPIGGLLRRLSRAGVPVTVLALTDGEAAYGPAHAGDLGPRRVEESRRGLVRLLGPDVEVVRLGLPDGALDRHVPAIARAVAAHAAPRQLYLTPHERDGHPDHEAAARGTALGSRPGCRTIRYPVWLWHWCRPGRGGVDWARARVVRLADDERAGKAAAIAEHASQLAAPAGHAPILPPHVLERFLRDREVVFA